MKSDLQLITSRKVLFKNISIVLFALFSFAGPKMSAATPVTVNRCQNLFSNFFKVPSYEPFKFGVNAEQALKAHFVIEGDQLFDTSGGAKIYIGKLLNLDAKYLFQWADKQTETALRKIGMNSFWMDEIIKGPGQTAGKGFYVSLDPTDSATYAEGNDTGLTVFKTTSLVVLEVPMEVMSRLRFDTELTKRIRNAGIDAIRFLGYRSTWLSIIQEQKLSRQVSLPLEVIQYVNQNNTENYDYILRYLKATFKNTPSERNVLPANDSLRKLVQSRNLTIEDIVAIEKSPNGLRNLDQQMLSFLVAQSFKRLKDVKRPDDLVALLKFFNSVPEANANWIARHFGANKLISKNAKAYKGILELFDAYGVASLTTKSKDEMLSRFAYMKKSSKNYVESKSTLDLKNIKTLDQLTQAAEKLFGVQFKFRQANAFMTEGEKPIEVTPESYKILSKNPLLTIKDSDEKTKIPGNKSVYVRYFTLDKLGQTFYPPSFFTGTFKDVTEQIISDQASGVNEKKLLPVFLKEATEKVFDKTIISDLLMFAGEPAQYRTPEDLYRVFMSLHPFHDGNGRFGRLLYEVLTAHDQKLQSANTLNLISYDFDLTLSRSEMKKQVMVGTLLQNWILLAKDDMDFITRSYWAIELVSRANPALRGSFPAVDAIAP